MQQKVQHTSILAAAVMTEAGGRRPEGSHERRAAGGGMQTDWTGSQHLYSAAGAMVGEIRGDQG